MTTAGGAVLVDAHVHLYPCFAPAAFLDAAAANMAEAARTLGLSRDTAGVLLFSESTGHDAFDDLARGRLDSGAWRIDTTDEPVVLRALAEGRPPLVLIAGRQIVSRERLEILALGLAGSIPDGGRADDVVAEVIDAGAIAVLPWGVNKWTGRRAALVRELFRKAPAGLHAGDNGGRPAWPPRPRLLAFAEEHGRLVLPGSDPLPLPAEVHKAGRYGFVVPDAFDLDRPFASLKRWLGARATSPPAYGRLERTFVFLGRQIALRVVQRRRR